MRLQVISADVKGFIKYWDSETFKFPTNGIGFKSVFQTNLMDCVKAGVTPKAIAVSKSGDRFSVVCNDLSVRVFDYASGKCLGTFLASMQVSHSKFHCVFFLQPLLVPQFGDTPCDGGFSFEAPGLLHL